LRGGFRFARPISRPTDRFRKPHACVREKRSVGAIALDDEATTRVDREHPSAAEEPKEQRALVSNLAIL
jgi:hypothetical protein